MSVPHPFHEFPKHLYADGPKTDAEGTVNPYAKGAVYPSGVQAQNAAEEKAYRDLGYGDVYVPQEFPKMLHKKVMGRNPVTNQPEQQIVNVTAADDEEVKAYQRKGWMTADRM